MEDKINEFVNFDDKFVKRPRFYNELLTLDKALTANIFKVIFTVFNFVRLSTVVSLYGLHLIAAPGTIKSL